MADKTPGLIQDPSDGESVVTWCQQTKERLWSELESLIREATSDSPRIELHGVGVFGLADAADAAAAADATQATDRYAVFQLLGVTGPPLDTRTSAVPARPDVEWKDEVLRIVLPVDAPRPPRLRATLFEKGWGSQDALLASGEIELPTATGELERGQLKLEGSRGEVGLCFGWTLSEAEDTVAMDHFKEIRDGLEYTLLELGKEKGRQEIAQRAVAESFD